MDYILGKYIDISEQNRILCTSANAGEYRQNHAAILRNNCLTKFRGWESDDPKSKNRMRAISAIRDGKLFFSTALGYNDPYDTLLYVNTTELLNSIRNSINSQMDDYIKKLKIKNYSAGCFAQLLYTTDNQEKFLQHINREIDFIKTSIHCNIKGICFSQNTLSTLMWAHYAKDHTGIALLYDIHELLHAKCYSEYSKLLNEKFELCSINYCKNRPDATKFINDYLLYRAAIDSFPVTFSGDILEYPDYSVIKNIILAKDTVWSYEKEVRLIPQMLNYWEESNIGYLDIKPKALILGAKIAKADRDEFLSAAKDAGDIVIYEAWLNDSQPGYEIVFQEVEI